MKILIATGIYPPDIGGPATYTVFLERLLPQYGIEVVVCAFTWVRKYPKMVRHFFYLMTLLRKGRHVDVLYALDTVSAGVPACVASVLLRKPLFLRVPGDYAWEQGQVRYGITESLDEYLESRKTYPLYVRLLAWLEKCVARKAQKIVVPSDYMKHVVEKWGIASEKVTRIYSALSPIQFTKKRDAYRTQYGYRGYTVTTAARLVPWKGVRVLIEAILQLRNEGMPISLLIIGDGPERVSLENFVEENTAGAYVHFLGQVEKQILWERIYASDVFVLNTSYEGLSHQLIEVMDIGTPIITTPVCGNRELIVHEVTGCLVPFNDTEKLVEALLHVEANKKVYVGYVMNAREKAKLFREEVVVPNIVTLFS